jgi:hypothetical protein
MKKSVTGLVATVLASLSLLAAGAAPASAAPVITGGLVNVTVTDVLNHTTVTILQDVNVGVALNAAANVCGVSVNLLAQQVGQGPVSCSTATQVVRIIQA